MGKFKSRKHFFVAFIFADYNKWLRNYKIAEFTIFVRYGGGGTKIEQELTRREGIQTLVIFDIVIIEKGRVITVCFVARHTSIMISSLLSKRSFLFKYFQYIVFKYFLS